MPGATDGIGNWLQPLGVAALFVEAMVVALSIRALLSLPRSQGAATTMPIPAKNYKAVFLSMS